jgi:protein-disulfide isomerase
MMSRDAGRGGTVRLDSPVGERDHVQGPATASVTLVEYGDFECPYCRAAVPIVEELRRILPDELLFVFRHFPLENLHPHALRAAEAAEAAASQGKFFEMHATLFEHQAALEDEDLLRYAADIDLDVARFGADLQGHLYADRVREDFRGGIRSGVRGTPTIYLDEARYDGVIGVQQLLSTIRESHPDVIGEGLDGPLRQPTIPRVVYERSPFRPSSG